LNRPIKFKSKPYPLTPLMGHQPPAHATQAQLHFPFSPFLPRTRASLREPAQPTIAKRRDLFPSFHPGQLTGRSHPSAFPFLPTAATPALSPARSPPTARLPFSSFLPSPRPRSLASPASRARLSPLRDSTAQPPRAPFSRTPTACAANPNPSRAAMPPRVPARTPKSPGRDRTRAPAPRIRTLAARLNSSHPCPFSNPPSPHLRRGEGAGGEPEEEDTAATAGASSPSRRPDRLHRRTRAARPCTASPRHRPSAAPSAPAPAPPVSHTAAALPLTPLLPV
jgi:hypothetical protein